MVPSTLINPDNPAEINAFPPTMPLEVALQHNSIEEICRAYNISEERWAILQKDDGFRAEVKKYFDELKTTGVSFKHKARLQADALLTTAWDMIHDPDDESVPANVRADLIKAIVRWGDLEPPKEQVQGPGNAFQININLG